MNDKPETRSIRQLALAAGMNPSHVHATRYPTHSVNAYVSGTCRCKNAREHLTVLAKLLTIFAKIGI